MKLTSQAPRIPIGQLKRTKIIATIGPSTMSYDFVVSMMRAGANGIRLNFSHGNHEEKSRQIEWVRKAARKLDKPVAVIQDLQGPKIRLGDFEGVVNIKKGEIYYLEYQGDFSKTGRIPTQYNLSTKIKPSERIYFYDGKVKAVVQDIKDGVIKIRAENDGILIKRKGINLPDTDFGGDILTKKDKTDIAFGAEHNIDYVALSFVQHASDVKRLRRMLKSLGSNAKIIAKIETRSAVENLESIIKEADAVMVARGDLAIETTMESVPIVQRQILALGMRYAKPTIVATQMMASMSEAPEPTRAEVSDVATSVIIGTDSVMLSDETASGKYPIEAIKIMKKVILYAESNSPLSVNFPHDDQYIHDFAIARAIIGLAKSLSAQAIVAETKSGATALSISSQRPNIPIISVTSDPVVAQQLAISYGVKSYIRPDDKHAARKLTDWLASKKFFKKGDIIVSASGQYPGVVGKTDTIKIRLLE